MTIELSALVRDVKPESTVLFFGAGSSIPSHAPTTEQIIRHLGVAFGQETEDFTLGEVTDLLEQKLKDRRKIVAQVRKLFQNLRPTGGLLNVPLYDWKSIYTTNYDELIEDAYRTRERDLISYASDFDFTVRGNQITTKLFKLHGTITQDVSFGDNARLILSGADYDHTQDYREKLYDRFRTDLGDSDLIIIGHSLQDPDIKEVIGRAVSLNAQAHAGGRITLLMYAADHARASIYESKGLQVAFGGIDEFLADLARLGPDRVIVHSSSDNPLDQRPALQVETIDVSHEITHAVSDVSRMFNGWPAMYADITAGFSFERTISSRVLHHLDANDMLAAVILGASGVGKTTTSRQVLSNAHKGGALAWEHKSDYSLQTSNWIAVAGDLQASDRRGLLFIDDAHIHVHEVNDLIDALIRNNLGSLKVVAASSRNNWLPRVKTPNLFKVGKDFHLSRLDSREIDNLLRLVDSNEVISRLVEDSFSGYSYQEKRRRLVERCEADMFVCMKNIFASENFDDIILREYADLPEHLQDIYRLVAALESAGVRVHRQLVIRLLGIAPTSISAILDNLTDIVAEYTISQKEHIYGWRGRHPVIDSIITKYKFNDVGKIIELYEKVIDNLNPTYDIEIRSVRELCNVEQGLARIPDKREQNRLLRKMASAAPGERVPRHRLIRNLISMGEFEQAQTEIRVFDKDFGSDGPVARYKVNLMVARATRTPGILKEDRISILQQARDFALNFTQRYQYSPQVYIAFCDVGLELFKITGDPEVYDAAVAAAKEAESRICDPQMTRMIRRVERRFAGRVIEETNGDYD